MRQCVACKTQVNRLELNGTVVKCKKIYIYKPCPSDTWEYLFIKIRHCLTCKTRVSILKDQSHGHCLKVSRLKKADDKPCHGSPCMDKFLNTLP